MLSLIGEDVEEIEILSIYILVFLVANGLHFNPRIRN